MAAKGPDQARAQNSNRKSAPTKIKVKQDMIDFIKAQGMTRALKRAGELKSAGTKGEAEFLEGVRRMYGERRLNESTKAAGTSKTSPTNYTTTSKNYPKPKSASTTLPKPDANYKAAPSTAKSSGIGPKEIAAGVAAAGLLVLSRGRGGAAAARLSPAFAKSGLGKALVGKPMNLKALPIKAAKAGDKVSGAVLKGKDLANLKAGQAAAKLGKPVTQAQYDAMKANAAARGIKINPSAKVAPKAPVKKAAATKPAPKPTAKTPAKTKPTPKATAKPTPSIKPFSKKKIIGLTGLGSGGLQTTKGKKK